MTEQFPQWRLRLISISAVLVVCVFIFRIIQVQIVRHEAYHRKALKQWHQKVVWPARRGSIFDRNGLPLAVTHRSYTLGVTPKHFPKDGDAAEYLADILGVTAKQLRKTLSKDRSYVPLRKDLRLSEEDYAKVSSMPGVRLDQNLDRLYPYDAIAPQLLGSVDIDGNGVAGVELAFQEILGGEDGWWLANKDALDNAFHHVNAPGKKPVNGNDLYLAIDSRVQSIVDFELEQALGRYGAKMGVAIVINPVSGDILALSEKLSTGSSCDPDHTRDNKLNSVSCIYEPGSTFKLITDSFLIESGSVDPYDAFYTEGGKAEFNFGKFKDDHPTDEWLTFKESFIRSSNICTIKAVKDSDPHEFYSYILRFGFGGRTGIVLPAESRGTLRSPAVWSARSLPSIAIGHEIGVTAIQMAMAYCALANGGELVVPRIALSVRDEKGNVVKDFSPISVRRVFSSETAGTIKDFCRGVVERGTGKKASVKGIPVAGKTGTSQKAGVSGYQPGKYVASFIGFAPLDDPGIVCLVILDEPKYPYYWGGESAAVVFGNVVEGINLATDLLYHETDHEVAVGRETDEKVEVPNFLRMTSQEAVKLASSCGLRISCSNERGAVYSQIPDPGSYIGFGEEVRLLFVAEAVPGNGKICVPDLTGLTIREARRMLIACGLKCRIKGFGVVKKQRPLRGRFVRRNSEITLYCRPGYDVSKVTGLALLSGGDR